MGFNVKVNDTILKPVEEVFDAIINPEKITKYFASKVSGGLTQNKKVVWSFEDVGMELEVDVLKVQKDSLISLQWSACGKPTTINIYLEIESDDLTKIEITESSFELNEEDVSKAMGQTQGWTDFICCMKGYLYGGINLRRGRTC